MEECLRGWNRILLDKTRPYQSGGTTRHARIQSQQISRRQKRTQRSDHDADHGHEHDDGSIPHQGYKGNHHHDHSGGRRRSAWPRSPRQSFNRTDSAAIYAGAGAIAYFAAASVTGGHRMPTVPAWQSHSGAGNPEWLEGQGRGYQSRLNQILRAAMHARFRHCWSYFPVGRQPSGPVDSACVSQNFRRPVMTAAGSFPGHLG